MNEQRIAEFWALAGKLIKLADIGVADASGVKSHMVNTAAQFASQTGGQELYDDLVTTVIPLQTRVNAVVGSLERVPALVKGSMDSYLRAVASELGVSASASLPTILGAMASKMTAAGHTIAPSGRLFNYFASGWGFSSFPTAAEPTLSDDLITTTII